MELRRTRDADRLGTGEQQRGSDRAGRVEGLVLWELGEADVLLIAVVLGPDQRANAREQRAPRCWQLSIRLRNAAHQSERQRIAVELGQLVLVEVVEDVPGIDGGMTRFQESRRLVAIERLKGEYGRFAAISVSPRACHSRAGPAEEVWILHAAGQLPSRKLIALMNVMAGIFAH